MTLQDTFYIIGIIAMTLYTVLLITVVFLLFYIKKKINEFSDKVKDMVAHPTETAVQIGSKVASALFDKLSKQKKSI